MNSERALARLPSTRLHVYSSWSRIGANACRFVLLDSETETRVSLRVSVSFALAVCVSPNRLKTILSFSLFSHDPR
jgi:hypothetical protein